MAGSSALGAASLLPGRAFAQAQPAGSLPARGEFVVRGAHVLTMDSGLGDLPAATCMCATARSSRSLPAYRRPAPRRSRPRHDLHARPDRYALASLDQCLPAVRAQRRSQARLFPVTAKYGPHYQAGGFLPQRPARPRRGAGRRHHHDAQLVPQHAQPGARRRRDPRHARVGIRGRYAYGNPLGAPNDRADGPGRSRPRQPRRAAGRRSGHARHLLPQHRRRFQSDARHGLDRNGKKGMERRARTGVADHAARFRSADHKASRRRRAARSGRAVRPSHGHLGRGSRDPCGQGCQLFDVADRRIPPARRCRRDPTWRTDRSRASRFRCRSITSPPTTAICSSACGCSIR